MFNEAVVIIVNNKVIRNYNSLVFVSPTVHSVKHHLFSLRYWQNQDKVDPWIDKARSRVFLIQR